jgi:hypothetical protein
MTDIELEVHTGLQVEEPEVWLKKISLLIKIIYFTKCLFRIN